MSERLVSVEQVITTFHQSFSNIRPLLVGLKGFVPTQGGVGSVSTSPTSIARALHANLEELNRRIHFLEQRLKE
jgi:hypothetical protein